MAFQLESSDDVVQADQSTRTPHHLLYTPGYAVLGVALGASWRLKSAPAVVAVATLATVLTCVLCVEFSRVRAKTLGLEFEARRTTKRERRSVR